MYLLQGQKPVLSLERPEPELFLVGRPMVLELVVAAVHVQEIFSGALVVARVSMCETCPLRCCVCRAFLSPLRVLGAFSVPFSQRWCLVQGETALEIAAVRGHMSVVNVLK